MEQNIGSSIFAKCSCCGTDNVEYYCVTCEEQQRLYCGPCDCLFHSHQERQGHDRKLFRQTSYLVVNDGIHCCHCHTICMVACEDCRKSFCSECDGKYHHHPNLERHTRKQLKRICNMCDEMFATKRCDNCNGWYCNTCDEARHRLSKANHQRKLVRESNAWDVLKEIRDLQSQISTLEKQVKDKETLLQKYIPQNIEGVWANVSSGYMLTDAVLSHDNWLSSNEYVCRIEIDGDVVPGYVFPYQRWCWVFHNGKEHRKSSYEVLTPSCAFEWIPCHKDYIPPHAVPGGKMKDGETLYIGRVKCNDGWYRVGKVQLSIKGCYNINFKIYDNYEILVWK